MLSQLRVGLPKQNIPLHLWGSVMLMRITFYNSDFKIYFPRGNKKSKRDNVQHQWSWRWYLLPSESTRFFCYQLTVIPNISVFRGNCFQQISSIWLMRVRWSSWLLTLCWLQKVVCDPMNWTIFRVFNTLVQGIFFSILWTRQYSYCSHADSVIARVLLTDCSDLDANGGSPVGWALEEKKNPKNHKQTVRAWCLILVHAILFQ